MDFNEKEYHAVVLGALLHDIGKFVQRAQKNPTAQDHSHWGEEWFQNHLAEKLTPVFGEKEKEIIRSAISNHHGYEEYISLADAISAGMDRIALRDEEQGDPFTDRLVSIFSKISISGNTKQTKYHLLSPLGIQGLKETFPIEDRKCSYMDYSELLKKFEDDVKAIRLEGSSSLYVINFFHFLLWKYCWCIPSATYEDEPDVPLFDHLKTTAAIAGSLYLYFNEKLSPIDITENAFSLIGGDISGIQNYIFDVLTQQGKVAKRLRARSFYVQIVSEIASHKVLRAFHLSLCNLILSAGGNFYVLTPNLKETENILESLRKEFDEWLLKEIKGELSVSLARVELCGKDLIQNFPAKLEALKTKQSLRKYRPFGLALAHQGKWLSHKFLGGEVIEGDEKVCVGCQKYPAIEPVKDEERYCERCSNDVRIGQLLPRAKYLAFFNDDSHEFIVFDHSFALWRDITFDIIVKEKPYLVMSLNFWETRLPGVVFKYIANHVPTTEEIPSKEVQAGQPVTFNDIANKSNGDKLLGYLKGDVDNMGRILREGFKRKETRPSVSRYAALSRHLETFFTGYLERRMENDFKEIYAVFCGGDDFFVVGPWDKVVDFSLRIREEFSLYCGENPDFTFSAGIFLAKPHEPISYCAEMVEKKLKESKRKEVKNSVTFFNQTVSWDELNKILEEGRRIIGWLNEKPTIVTRRFVHNLREYGEMAWQSRIWESGEEVQTDSLKFIPLMAYEVNRHLRKEATWEVFQWVWEMMPSEGRPRGGNNLRYLCLIMEYALRYTRGGQ